MITTNQHGETHALIVMNVDDLKAAIYDIIAQYHQRENADRHNGNESGELISRSDASKALNVTLPTLWRWAKMGYLNPVKMGAKTMYRKQDIESMLKSGVSA